ncbi:hypothetical protein [Thermoflavifilum thermophilum]|uniref:Uncharacterized protein n=1 Tax=Thermoflavifilum thermophilum TaxID=1393122 RepID=A0A1I7NGP2_9BACT|nr:hypothetical protein [Thermoflavifilum thermophilum]SFV33716.1 hypothetical protein SAMN05660895_1790 [Thermoflavifilum thermophilum]
MQVRIAKAAEKATTKAMDAASVWRKINQAAKEVKGIKEVKHVSGPGEFKKFAVIGENFDKKVMPFANKLKEKGLEVEVFQPSKEALEGWRKLLKEYDGKQIPDQVVREQKIFKENVIWREKIQKEGYDILSTGGSGKSTF